MSRCLMGALLCVAAAGCVGPLSENLEHAYPNAKVAKAAGHGWIPDILPEDAANIREVHNIDTNRTWGCFTTSQLGTVRSALTKLGAESTVGPIHEGPRELFRDFSWWPEPMGSATIEAQAFREPHPYSAAQQGFLVRVGIHVPTGTVCFHRSL